MRILLRVKEDPSDLSSNSIQATLLPTQNMLARARTYSKLGNDLINRQRPLRYETGGEGGGQSTDRDDSGAGGCEHVELRGGVGGSQVRRVLPTYITCS